MSDYTAQVEMNYRDWLAVGVASGFASKPYCSIHMEDETVTLDCQNATIHPDSASVIASRIFGDCNCCLPSVILLPEVFACENQCEA